MFGKHRAPPSHSQRGAWGSSSQLVIPLPKRCDLGFMEVKRGSLVLYAGPTFKRAYISSRRGFVVELHTSLSRVSCHRLAPHVAPSCHLLSHGNSPSWSERCRTHNKRVFPAPSLHHLSPPVAAVIQLLRHWLLRGRRCYGRIWTGTSWHHGVLTSWHPTINPWCNLTRPRILSCPRKGP